MPKASYPPVTCQATLLQALLLAPGCGTELMLRVEQRTGILLKSGAVYPTLRNMERDGLITRGPKTKNALRARRACTITASGRRLATEQSQLFLLLGSWLGSGYEGSAVGATCSAVTAAEVGEDG